MKIHGNQVNINNAIAALPATAQKVLSSYFNSSQDGGYISPANVRQILTSTNWSLQTLMNYLVPIAQLYALPPISNYKVGAVVHGISGALYFGANVEFVDSALSFCVHAEQASIAHAISYGELGVDYLAISAAPCGYCRQFLYEITNSKTTPDINILINSNTFTLSSLLPQAFGPNNLLNPPTQLMQPQAHGLKITPNPTDPVVLKALAAANISYAPYSLDYSGVCLATSTDSYAGAYAENAAFNPSMSPLQASLVVLIMSGDDYQAINRAVLVETNASASQLSATASVLSSIAPSVKLQNYLAM